MVFFLNAFNEQHTDLIYPVVHVNISRSPKLAVSFKNKCNTDLDVA